MKDELRGGEIEQLSGWCSDMVIIGCDCFSDGTLYVNNSGV